MKPLLILALSLPALAPAAQLGTQVHFPSKLAAPQAEWDAAEAATMEAGKAFPGGWLRYAALGYEKWWLWYAPDPQSLERERRILTYIKRAGMRPIRVDTPHPWPGSSWAPAWAPWQWGQLREGWLPQMARNAKQDMADYRRLLKAVGFKESEAAWQDGNEPASGHPGGNPTLPQGAWDPMNLRRMREADDADAAGTVWKLSPAWSMQDHPAAVAGRELLTSGADKFAWAREKDAFTMHFRFYRPDAGTPERYADLYVAELRRRAGVILALPVPKSGVTREKRRSAGVWVTEGYIAQGDSPEPRSECVRLITERLRQGVPGVAAFVWYRFWPEGGSQSSFAFTRAEREATVKRPPR